MTVHPGMVVDRSGDCYRLRAEVGLPVEMIEIYTTLEGDPILMIRRLLPDGQEETFSDMTRDSFGTQAWFHLICDVHQPRGSQMEDCEPAEQLP